MLGFHLTFAECSLQRRNDPREPSLENIVCGADLERFNRHLLVQCSRNEDERHFRMLLDRDFQRRHAVDRGRRVIYQDDIKTTRLNRDTEMHTVLTAWP